MSERLFVHMRCLAALLVLRERIHESFQAFTVGSGQLNLESMSQPALKSAFPAFAPVVQVGTATSELAGRIHQDRICGSYEADHLPFREY